MEALKLTEEELKELSLEIAKFEKKKVDFPIIVSCKSGCQGQCDGSCKGTICAKH